MKKNSVLAIARPIGLCTLLVLLSGGLFASPKQESSGAQNNPPVTITVAAAASLKNSYEQQLIPQFQKKYPWITVEGTYDSSGKLQTQIEQGLAADVFMSAASAQMNSLVSKNLIVPASVLPLLENKIVLIKPVGIPTAAASFETAPQAAQIALGDPASVPAGQYAKEAFTNLGIWDAVQAKASFGTNVTEVLNWVAEGSADLGVVYATDAASNKNVEIIAEVPAGALSTPVIYPIGITTKAPHPKEAQLFVDFLASKEGLDLFKAYGFAPGK
ncbi:molybdate ABC transporter substrate-binding protein [Breznakiellaceae bacterium SP9]